MCKISTLSNEIKHIEIKLLEALLLGNGGVGIRTQVSLTAEPVLSMQSWAGAR